MLEHLLAAGEICWGGKARIFLRPVETFDGLLVSLWRNSPLARASFYTQAVVTPDSHADWLAAKDPYDQVWMACKYEDGTPVGMTGLHIDPAGYVGEYGRTYVAPHYQGQGYAKEIEYTLMATAFELFELDFLWLEAFTANTAILALHDKTGWQRAGVDVPGHTHPRGPVQYMTIDRQQWAARRPAFYELIGVPAPEWLP